MDNRRSISRQRWRELSASTQTALGRKIVGLYGQHIEESAFDALIVDKQQALLIFARRLNQLGLWPAVRSIENIYGTGGVGMDFTAAPLLSSLLERDGRFVTWFAARRGVSRGFRERRRALAALHFLQVKLGGQQWSVHFDLYGPLASPRSAWRHFFYESLRGSTPEWHDIDGSLNGLAL